jgi:hypothetical protein
MIPASRDARSPAMLACLMMLAAGLLSCAPAVPESGVSASRQGSAEEDLISSVKKEIDYHLQHQDVMEDVEAAGGKTVKWHGIITKIYEDRIQVCGRMVLIRSHDGSPVPDYIDRNDPRNYHLLENFLVTLDHPLPREKRLGDMTPSVTVWDAVYVIGRLIGTETLVTESGVNLTLPVLQGFAITKESDRDFQGPVWVTRIKIK